MAGSTGWRDGPQGQRGEPIARAPSRRTERQATQKPRIDLAAAIERYPAAETSHPYIVAKRGMPDGLRVVPGDDPLTIRGQSIAGCLAVPVRSFDGELLTVQYIPPLGAGKKLNAPVRS